MNNSITSARQKKEEEKANGEGAEPALKEWVSLLVRAGFWALLIYLFIFQVSVVSGPSMQPNFVDYDKLLIDKVTYRFSPVKRFDVIVFEAVDWDKNPWHAQDYIKRVIGLPGEKVVIRDSRIRITGPEGTRLLEEDQFATGQYSRLDNSREMGFYGLTFVVPPKHYFVMGDNRGISRDSRAEGLGFVPEGQIKGLVRLRWWPWGRLAWFSRLN